MADVKNKKEYEKALAAFIKEKKPLGQVVYDELTNRLATPYELGAEAMDELIQKSKMLVLVSLMKMVNLLRLA